MAWLAVDKDGTENISEYLPIREDGRAWGFDLNNDDVMQWWYYYAVVKLPKGSVEKLIGKPLTWDDEPVEI